jgi:hypothetical protein
MAGRAKADPRDLFDVSEATILEQFVWAGGAIPAWTESTSRLYAELNR